MDTLPKDVIMLMVVDFDLSDLLNLCLSNKYYNNILCKNKTFWMNKILHDYGKFGHVPKNINKGELSWKNYYKLLHKLV